MPTTNYATAFLSHSSVDKPVVREVAIALGRCGVIPWLDEFSLPKGGGQRKKLQEAARESVTTVLFLSKEAVVSRWVDDELRAVLTADPRRVLLATQHDPNDASLIPRVLQPYVKHAVHGGIDHNMVVSAGWANPGEVAGQIAGHVFDGMGLREAPYVNIILDQRADFGERVRLPDPPKKMDLSWPTLVFRHDAGARDGKEMLRGDAWTRYQEDMRRGISRAFGGNRAAVQRRVHIAGATQLSLVFTLGLQFRRSSAMTMSVHGRQGAEPFDNHNQELRTPLKGGNAGCWDVHPEFAPVAVTGSPATIDLFIGSAPAARAAAAYRQATGASHPAIWIPSGVFDESSQVLQRVADVVALLLELGQPELRLFTTLPFHVLPLLAANLDMVAGGSGVTFMEHDRNASKEQPETLYVPLFCPFGI